MIKLGLSIDEIEGEATTVADDDDLPPLEDAAASTMEEVD
jgi:hypothetical protein